MLQPARRAGVPSVICLDQTGKLVAAVEECTMRLPAPNPPEHADSRTRFRLPEQNLIALSTSPGFGC